MNRISIGGNDFYSFFGTHELRYYPETPLSSQRKVTPALERYSTGIQPGLDPFSATRQSGLKNCITELFIYNTIFGKEKLSGFSPI
jgi:hypothetical protein